MDYDEFYDEYSSMLDDPEEFWSEYHVEKSKKRPLPDETVGMSRADYIARNPNSPGLQFINPDIQEEQGDEYSEYSDEVDMVKNNLHTIVRACKDLANSLIADENLPEWVEEKISMAKQNMVTVAEYIQSQHEQGHIYKDTEEDYGMNGYESATASPIQPGTGRDDSVHEDDAYFDRLRINLKSAMSERSLSQAQHDTMVWANKDPAYARRRGIKPSVALDFVKADTGRDIRKIPKRVLPKKKK
jgi:hypothetical protein